MNSNSFLETVSQNQSQVKRNSSLAVNGGALVLGIFQDSDEPVQSSSYLITSKESFTYAKFVIRAAIPEGMMVKPSIYLEPIEGTGIEKLYIVSNTDSNGTYYGLDFPEKEYIELINHKFKKPILSGNPFDFHTYVLEWTEKELHWMVDDKHLYRTKFGRDFKDFCQPFKLTINLETVDSEMVSKHTCSLLILDYVRVYQVLDKSSQAYNFESVPDPNMVDSLKICTNIKHLHQSLQNNPSSNNFILIISISSIILIVIIVIIIALNVCLFKRLNNKTKENEEIENKDKFYDDVREMENIYEDPNENNQNDVYNECNDYQEYNEFSNNKGDPEPEGPYYTKFSNKYGIEQAPP